MYADKITDSMQQTIDETSRRRALQLAYNEEHGITPQAIVKARNAIIGLDTDELLPQGKPGQSKSAKRGKGGKQGKQAQAIPYANEYTAKVDIAADPVMAYLSADALRKLIDKRRVEMVEAAKQMNFIEAAQMRDEIIAMEDQLSKMPAES